MQIIGDFLNKHQITDTDFVIGVSGGADSLALVLMFKEEFPQYNIVALTVDHQLRTSSRSEAEYVSKIMKEHNIEHHILTWKNNNPKTGIEEKAREERYNLLCHWAEENKIKNLVVAHHLFDQAETFLMRLQRGSGIYGLSSMEEIFQRGNTKILRPLLATSPDILKKYLTDRNIEWKEDESNQCTDFLRVKIRKFLPLLSRQLGITPEKICCAVSNLQNTKHFIEDTAAQIICDKIHNWNNNAYSFDEAEFLSWHNELKFFILGKLIIQLGEQSYIPEAESLLDLIQKMETDNFESATLGMCIIIKSELRFWIIPECRNNNFTYSNNQWVSYLIDNPELRGIKIPAKLKSVLLNKKN